jgi:hypothetical protein
MSLNIRVL